MIPCHIRRVVLALYRVDFRKQFNGLLAECYRLGFDPYEGDCIVFLKKDRKQIRVLMGDSRGLYLVSRRFDGGCLKFGWPFFLDPEKKEISSAELSLLLDGVSFLVSHRVRSWK